MPRARSSFVCFCVVLSMTCASASAATTQQIRDAIAKGKEYLYSVQKDGNWEIEEKHHNQPTGQTAMVLYALLASGESANEARLAPAIDYLKKNKTTGTYALGMRCQAWLMLPPKPDVRAAMTHDAKILLSSIKQKGEGKGFYFYNPGPRTDEYDHSASQYGVLGMWAAAQVGVEIPNAYWDMVEKAWIAHQDPGGGWAYQARGNLPNTTGMTAVGVATLFITQEYLHGNDGIPCKGNVKSPAIDKGLKWLTDNNTKFATNEHFFANRDYPYATIYAIERVGLAGGLKYFGNVNWYEKGADWLVKSQQKDGAWPAEEGMPHFSTSMALLFLSRGSAPVLMNKLDYSASAQKEANWNQRPRDVANIARWTGQQIEREVAWQIVPLNAPVEELHDAPILYMAGNETIALTPEQEQKLKLFIEQGGIVLGNADCASPAFTNSFRALGQKLFPLYEFTPLPENHPIYANQMFDRAKWKRKPVIFSQRNGARELMLLLPTADAGRSWQLKETRTKDELFQFATNLFLYAVDKQGMRVRGEPYIVTPDPKAKPSKPIKVARLKYNGNADPEPGGWRRLATIMHNASQGELTIETVTADSGKLSGFDVAHLTGTVEFALTPSEREEIKRFVAAGGTLIVDATGGASAFGMSVEKELAEMFGADAKQLDTPLSSADALYRADGKPLGEVGYRPFARTRLGAIDVPQLRGITKDGRLAVIYSKEDLSVGLVGQPVDGIIGYSPQSATTLMTKALLYATQKKVVPTSRPATK